MRYGSLSQDISMNNLIEIKDMELSTTIADDWELNHYFDDGLYVRELNIPKNMFVVGKKHKHS